MIIFGTILIAIIFAVFLLIKYRSRIVWWELVILIAIPTALSFGSKALTEICSVNFTEYWGDEIVSIYEEEPYNEWHSEMCSYECNCTTDDDGYTSCSTCWEDCSHQDDYGPSWYAITKLGKHVGISEAQYDKWNKQFGGNRIKIETIKNYDSNDRCYYSSGTKFAGQRVGTYSYNWRTDWDRDYSTSVPLTTEHSYENRIKASDYTVFNYIEVTEEKADSLSLFDYPNLDNSFTYPCVLGYNSNKVQKMFHKINGHLGSSKQIRVWVLVHDTTESDIGYMQESYWVGGNKNELVINIGVDGDDISWCHTFSWSDIQSLKDDIEMYVMDEKVLNDSTFSNIANYVHKESEERFERLEFTQFDYLTVEPPLWGIILSYIFTILVCLGISAFNINNDFESEDNRYHRNDYNKYNQIERLRKIFRR